MTDESDADHPSSHQTATQPEPQSIIHKGELAAGLPPEEREQPDPALQLSAGRVGPVSITLWALAIAVIIGVAWYGFTRPAPKAEHATAPAVMSSDRSTAASRGNPGVATAVKPAAPPSTTNGQH